MPDTAKRCQRGRFSVGIEENEWHGLFDDAGGVAERFGLLAGRANGFDRRGFPP